MSRVEADPSWMRLRISEVQKEFVQVGVDMQEALALDGIDELPFPPRFRIRSHDFYGPLPDIVVDKKGGRFAILDRTIAEAEKMAAAVRLRTELAKLYPGGHLLVPTCAEDRVFAGIRVGDSTVSAEGPSILVAYRKLIDSVQQLRKSPTPMLVAGRQVGELHESAAQGHAAVPA